MVNVPCTTELRFVSCFTFLRYQILAMPANIQRIQERPLALIAPPGDTLFRVHQNVTIVRRDNTEIRRHLPFLVEIAMQDPIRIIVGKVSKYNVVQENMFQLMVHRRAVYCAQPVLFKLTSLLLNAKPVM